MHSVASFLANALIIFFQRFLRDDQCFQLVGEGVYEVIDFIDRLRRADLVLPEQSGFEGRNDFCVII